MIINLTHLHRLEEFTDGQTKLLQDWQTQTDKYKIQNHETNQYKAQSWIRAVGGRIHSKNCSRFSNKSIARLLQGLKSTMDRYQFNVVVNNDDDDDDDNGDKDDDIGIDDDDRDQISIVPDPACDSD